MAQFKCFITGVPITKYHEEEGIISYYIRFNDFKGTLHFYDKADWSKGITEDVLKIYRALLWNNVWPFHEGVSLYPALLNNSLSAISYPKNFEERINRTLKHYFLAGGQEYKSISIHKSYPEAVFASSHDEGERVIKALITRQYFIEDKSDVSRKAFGRSYRKFDFTEAGRVEAGKMVAADNSKRYALRNNPIDVAVFCVEHDAHWFDVINEQIKAVGWRNVGNIVKKEMLRDQQINHLRSTLKNDCEFALLLISKNSVNNPIFRTLIEIAIENEMDRKQNPLYFWGVLDDPDLSSVPRLTSANMRFYDLKVKENLFHVMEKMRRHHKTDQSQTEQDPDQNFWPQFKLSNSERYWMKYVFDLLLQGLRLNLSEEFPKHWYQVEKDFNPTRMRPELMPGGSRLTLLGLTQIPEAYSWLPIINEVILAVKKILVEQGPNKDITAGLLLIYLPAYSEQEINTALRLMADDGDFIGSHGIAGISISFKIDDQRLAEQYRHFTSLRDHLRKQHFAIEGKMLDASEEEKSDSNQTVISNPANLNFREDTEEAILDAPELGADIAEIIDRLPPEQGRMVGVFGAWGRGKTMLIREIFKQLKSKKSGSREKYIRIDFHAWKYQDTPASWAYLYELFAQRYFFGSSRNNLHNFFFYQWNRIVLNFKRHGFLPLGKMILTVAGTVVAATYFATLDGWLAFAGWSSLVGAFAVYFGWVKKSIEGAAAELINKYGKVKSFRDAMGLQAEIQKELILLLKHWLPDAEEEVQKIILIVEDIDRCPEEKIVQIVDALRVIIEDHEVAKRVVVLAAIDVRILDLAIRHKYRSSSDLVDLSITYDEDGNALTADGQEAFMERVSREYMDKLFISGIKLGDLSIDDRHHFIDHLEQLSRELNGTDKVKSDVTEESSANSAEHKATQTEDDQFHNFNGSVQGNSGDNGEEGSAQVITEKIAQSTPDISATEVSSFDLSEVELEILKSVVASRHGITPRQIRIYYYRYLLAKNLLLRMYQSRQFNNPWTQGFYATEFAELLMRFSIDTPLKELPQYFTSRDNQPAFMQKMKEEDRSKLRRVLEMVIGY